MQLRDTGSYYPLLVRLNSELLLELKEALLRAQFNQSDTYTQLVSFFAGKACKTHEAIVILAERGFGQDAGVLLRSLVNLVINAYWIHQDPATRVERYMDYDWILREAIADIGGGLDAQSRLTSEKCNQLEAQDREIKGRAREAKQKHSYNPRRSWSGKSIRKMAEDVGLQNYYSYAYQLLSNIEHSNSRSTTAYLEEVSSTYRLNVGPGPEYVRVILATAYCLLIDLFAVADKVLSLEVAKALDEARRVFEVNKATFTQD